MNIKRITIEFEPKSNNEFEKLLATKATFEMGCWSANGPMKSNYLEMLHEVWKVMRARIKADNDTHGG